MSLKFLLMYFLGYYKFRIQASSDLNELLSNDESEENKLDIEKYLWNQLTLFSRHCLENIIREECINSKNFLVSLKTSFDTFNIQNGLFINLFDKQLCFILYFEIDKKFNSSNFSSLIYKVTDKSNKYIKDLLKRNIILVKKNNPNLLEDSYELFIKEKFTDSKFYLYLGFKDAFKKIINDHRFERISTRFFRKKSNRDLTKSFFVVFSDFLNEYDQTALCNAVVLPQNYCENRQCLHLYMFSKKKFFILNRLMRVLDQESLRSYYMRFSLFYYEIMKVNDHNPIETSTYALKESIFLLEKNFLELSSINDQKNVKKILSFNILEKKDFFKWINTNSLKFNPFFNLNFSLFIEKFKAENQEQIHKKIKIIIIIGLNDIKKYNFTLKLNRNDELVKFKVKRYLNSKKKYSKVKIEEIPDMVHILDEIAYEYVRMSLNVSFFRFN